MAAKEQGLLSTANEHQHVGKTTRGLRRSDLGRDLGRLLLAHKEKPFTSGLRVAPAIGEKGSK